MATVASFSRSSTCIDDIRTDARRREVRVAFSNGNRYLYSNVSPRAIYTLLTSQDVSLGRWVNNNCVRPDTVDCKPLS